MLKAQDIYDHSPVFVQNVMASLSGFHKNTSRHGTVYHQHRHWLREFDDWPLERKLAFQDEQVRALIRHAAANSALYRRIYDGIDLNGIRGVKDLVELPIVDKELLRANMQEAYAVPRKGSVEGHTGGTTGKSLVVRFRTQDLMRRMALLDHFKAKHGFEHRKMRRATFMGKHIIPPRSDRRVFWRYNLASNQMLYSSFHLTEENLPLYIDNLNRVKPHSIDGFFSSMLEVANYLLRVGKTLDFQPVAIFPTAETVTPHGRALIERAFGAPVFDQYASSEGAPFITECSAGELHVELSSGVFETVSENSDEMLVTSFTTYGTPLIRYAIGDSFRAGPLAIPCACGIETATVHSLKGRVNEFLYRSDGAKINAGNVANLFKGMPNSLINAQLTQVSMNEIRIALQVDEDRYSEAHDRLLETECRHKFGSGTKFIFEKVTEIPRSSSGKRVLIVNPLADS